MTEQTEPVFLPQVAELLKSSGLTLEAAYLQGLPKPDLFARPECWSHPVFFGWFQKWLDDYPERNAQEAMRIALDRIRKG